MSHPLDRPQWTALTGRHADLARRQGRAAAYPGDVASMSGLEDADDPGAWRDLADLLGAGGWTILILADRPTLPAFAHAIVQRGLLQMQGPLAPPAAADAPEGLVRLGLADGPDMVALAASTEPGPMLPRTVILGDYWGVRREGRLVAMAGERLHLDGWREISGVCTDPDHRGQGLARYLVARLTRDILSRGERAFLHCELGNASAIALYESLGFTRRTEMSLTVARMSR
jgi:GNAT superfamily N-acetyltransferase